MPLIMPASHRCVITRQALAQGLMIDGATGHRGLEAHFHTVLVGQGEYLVAQRSGALSNRHTCLPWRMAVSTSSRHRGAADEFHQDVHRRVPGDIHDVATHNTRQVVARLVAADAHVNRPAGRQGAAAITAAFSCNTWNMPLPTVPVSQRPIVTGLALINSVWLAVFAAILLRQNHRSDHTLDTANRPACAMLVSIRPAHIASRQIRQSRRRETPPLASASLAELQQAHGV